MSDTESGAPALPPLATYFDKARKILAECDPATANALIEREIAAWQVRYKRFIDDPDPWLKKYPRLTVWDFAETINGLAGMTRT
jgi:hypothetical protein